MSTHPIDTESLAGEDLVAITERIAAHFREGGTLGDLAGISDEQFEALYATAYRLYGTDQFEGAAKVFAYLGMTDPYDRRYTLGLGACQQMLKKWDEAIAAYTLCIALDAGSEFVTFTCGVERVEDLTQSFTNEVLWELGPVFGPLGLHDAHIGRVRG